MTELLEIVRERPIDEKPSQPATCPLCDGKNLHHRGTSTTLIGGGDGTIDGDPNHRHEEYQCRDCGGGFVRETKHGNVWYTRESRILRGIPSCFERYTYTCAECGGAVERRYTKLDGASPVSSLGYQIVDGEWKKDFRTFYTCTACGHGGETDMEYWHA